MASSKNQEREAREARDRLTRYNARQAVHTHQVKRRKRDNLWAVGAVVVIAALATVAQVYYFTAGPGTPAPTPSASASADAESQNVGDVPSADVSEYRTWTGELTLNDVALSISLDGAAAPQAVASFVTDIQSGYYTGKACHRLFVDTGVGLIQCGSLNGDGATDTSYSYGPVENAPADGNYVTGTIAIANSGTSYSNGRQFFIVFDDSLLGGEGSEGYSVIGTVTMGLDQLESQIVAGGITPSADSTTDGAPVIPTTITAATIQ